MDFCFDKIESVKVKWDWYSNKDANPTSLLLATDGEGFFVTCYHPFYWADYVQKGKIIPTPLPEDLRGIPVKKLAYHQEALLPLAREAWSKEL